MSMFDKARGDFVAECKLNLGAKITRPNGKQGRMSIPDQDDKKARLKALVEQMKRRPAPAKP